MSVKVYIAAPFPYQHIAKEIKEKIEKAGYTVTSRWIDTQVQNAIGDPSYEEALREQAVKDVQDVHDCQILVLINSSISHGGKEVETGMAIAWAKPIILVGEGSNIFHYLQIPKVPDIEGAIDLMDQWVQDYKDQLNQDSKDIARKLVEVS